MSLLSGGQTGKGGEEPKDQPKRKPIAYVHHTCYKCKRMKSAASSHCKSPTCPWCATCAPPSD